MLFHWKADQKWFCPYSGADSENSNHTSLIAGLESRLRMAYRRTSTLTLLNHMSWGSKLFGKKCSLMDVQNHTSSNTDSQRGTESTPKAPTGELETEKLCCCGPTAACVPWRKLNCEPRLLQWAGWIAQIFPHAHLPFRCCYLFGKPGSGF